MRSLVTFIFLYACESWILTAELQRRIQATEIRCYRKILRISYKVHVTDEEVLAKIQRAIGPHERPHDDRHILTEEEVGRQHQAMDRPGVRQVQEGSGEQGKMEETGCEIIYGAPTTLAV